MVKNNTKFKETELGPIPEEWEVLPIYELAEWINGLAFKDIHFTREGRPVIKINELKYGITEQTQFTQDVFDEDYHLRNKDLLFSWSGSPETSIDAFWYSLPDGWLNQHIFKVKPRSAVTNEFLFYLLKANKPRLIDIARDKQTTGLGHVTVRDLKRFDVALPSLAEQKSISSILSSLDDKIELNRQINANLEKIASALFKRWFVDFEFPDKNGKPYKSSGGKMVESEMGEIPEGWRVSRIGDEFTVIMGQSPSGETYNESGNGIPFYQGRTDFGFRFPSRRIFCTGPTRTAKPLDTLISVRAPVGDVNMASEDCCIGRGVGAIRKTGYSSYVFYSIKSLQDEIAQFDSEGTVFGSINKESLSNITFVAPQADLVVEFETIAGYIDGQIMNLTQEMGRLVNTRDSLLPRLMNGKLRTE